MHLPIRPHCTAYGMGAHGLGVSSLRGVSTACMCTGIRQQARDRTYTRLGAPMLLLPMNVPARITDEHHILATNNSFRHAGNGSTPRTLALLLTFQDTCLLAVLLVPVFPCLSAPIFHTMPKPETVVETVNLYVVPAPRTAHMHYVIISIRRIQSRPALCAHTCVLLATGARVRACAQTPPVNGVHGGVHRPLCKKQIEGLRGLCVLCTGACTNTCMAPWGHGSRDTRHHLHQPSS